MELLELDLDVILTIIQHIDPADIIRLGQTCRVFRSICEESAIWIAALRRMRRNSSVYPPTLPPWNYTSLAQIQREITAPDRFISLLKNHHKRSGVGNAALEPQHRRIIHPLVSEEIYYNTVVLVSGGRVLVTGSVRYLSIWDLTQDIPRELYTWDFGVYHIVGVCPTEQGYLRIVAVSPVIVGREIDLAIFDFDYATSKPQGRYTLKWELDGDAGVFFPMHTLVGDQFIYTYKGVLFIWNFIEDTWSSWSIIDEGYEELFVEPTSNLIIFISRKAVSGWRPDPRISVSRHMAKASPKPLKPEFVVDIPNLPPGVDQANYAGDRMWNREAIWYKSSDFSCLFDIASMDEGQTNYTFSSYEIHVPTSRESGRVEFISKSLLPLGGPASSETAVNAYRISNGKFFKIWSNEGRIQLAFRDDPRTPADRLEEDRYIQVDLSIPDILDAETLGIGAFSFDPVSGRLCHIDEDNNVIVVLDYLPQ
ncbi:hypothetical protein CVT24_003804 [Panaeolus cyanescens]|uniref:F-box domain-containing protein n=1 Tax=Panaeolus cyanescens TaxID=181874 RepID=A0A409VUW4_9AGAR|nr:hypothetical protein CVT24_003804 [Panaeolus cyanescens]